MNAQLIICGQDQIAPDECIECGGWLHHERRGGYHDQYGARFCSEDCIASYQEHANQSTPNQHLVLRDLLCSCDICHAAGHPTAAERAEYAAWEAAS
jgi:hypothetical protein